MAGTVRGFVKLYAAIVVAFLLLAILLTVLLKWPFLVVAADVYFGFGVAYIFASLLAWTGFANVYRYSPTLYLGSPSYRQQVVRGPMWKEGRDTAALLVGLAFGLALIALGAAIWDPLFIVVDAVGVALVALVLRNRSARAAAKA